MKYAEILNGRVRAIGDAEVLPVFSPECGLIAVPLEKEIPKEGYLWDKEKFVEAEIVIAEPVETQENKIDKLVKDIEAIKKHLGI